MADEYELFRPGTGCEGGLPVNPIRDEFTLVRFSPVEMVAGGGPVGPAVVPRDVVNPRVVDEIRRRFPNLPYDVFAKGGLPFIRKWEGVIDPPADWLHPPEIEEVEVDDVGDFVANPRVSVGNRTYQPELTPENVEELLESGTTLVDVGRGRDHHVVRIEAPAVEAPPRVAEMAVPVGTLSDFLANPTVTLETQPGRAELTAENVNELATLGISRVDVVSGRLHRSVYVTTVDSPVGGNGSAGPGARDVMVTRSAAMMTAAGPGSPAPSYRLVEKLPTIATLASDPAQLESVVSAQVLPRFELVLYLPYRQTWELLGYSRGELLNSVSLGPQEETTIEIFTWDRLKRMREEAFVFEQEGTLDVAFTDKVTTETIKEMTTSADWGWNVKGEVTVPLEYVDIGLEAGYDNRDSVKTLHRGTQQVIGEAVRKASSRIKSSRQTKVTESEELGRETKVARKIKNPNMCQTLNLDYFEVLATYRVTTRPLLEEARLCVLAPNPISDAIDRQFLLGFEGELRDALLSNTYLPGFDAARKLAAWERLCSIRCAPPCPCEIPAPPPPRREERPAETPVVGPDPVQAARTAVAQAAQALRTKISAIEGASINTPGHTTGHIPPASMCDLANDVFGSHPEGEWTAAKGRYHMWMYRKVVLEFHVPRFWAACQRFRQASNDSPETLDELVRAADPQVIDALNLLVRGITYKVKALEMLADLVKGFCWNLVPFVSNLAFDDGGLDAAFQRARIALRDYQGAVTAASAATTTTSPTAPEPESPQERETEEVAERGEPPVYTEKELAEAHVAEAALISHLRHHESYYRQSIWARFDPGDRFVFLSLLGNLMKHVENEVVGFVGKKAALPFRLSRNRDVARWFEQNVLNNPGFAENPDATRTTLPTRGVLVESRLGACNGCEEFIVEHRDLDLRQKGAEVGLVRERLAQERLETSRFKTRLEQNMLGDPEPSEGDGAIRVVVEKEDGGGG